MLALMDATAPASCIYYVFVIVIGALFLMNYTVAMMCMAYAEVKKESNDGRTSGGRGAGEGLLLQVGLNEISHEGGNPEIFPVGQHTLPGSVEGCVVPQGSDGPHTRQGSTGLKGLADSVGKNMMSYRRDSPARIPDRTSYPLKSFLSDINHEALRRIRAMSSARGMRLGYYYDAVSYLVAGMVRHL